MVRELLELAYANPAGFTVRIPTLEHVTEGIAVAYWETQRDEGDSPGIGWIYSVIAHATTHNQVIGGWRDDETKLWYWDSVKIFPNDQEDEAIAFGRYNKQIAIYDITNKRLIKL